jgi:hypothetical protein
MGHGLLVAPASLCLLLLGLLLVIMLLGATSIYMAQRAACACGVVGVVDGAATSPATPTTFADALFLTLTTVTTLGVLPHPHFAMARGTRTAVALLAIVGPPLFLFGVLEGLWVTAAHLRAPVGLAWVEPPT